MTGPAKYTTGAWNMMGPTTEEIMQQARQELGRMIVSMGKKSYKVRTNFRRYAKHDSGINEDQLHITLNYSQTIEDPNERNKHDDIMAQLHKAFPDNGIEDSGRPRESSKFTQTLVIKNATAEDIGIPGKSNRPFKTKQ